MSHITPERLADIQQWTTDQLADDDDPGNIWVVLASMMLELLNEIKLLQGEA